MSKPKVDPLLEKIIVTIVETYPGIKETELYVRIFDETVGNADLQSVCVIETIKKLAEEEKIVPVSYTLESMPYREKTIWFPKGTEIIPR